MVEVIYLKNVKKGGCIMKKLNEKKWKAFFIEDICDIYSGQDIYQRERINGETPYITATAEQNGIGYFVDNENETLEENCISVNRNGSVGFAFYHPYKALFGNDTRKLKLKLYGNNKYIGMFIARAITLQKEKYGYGLKMGTERLRRQKIMLPVTETDEPDYEYMDVYMKEIEKKILERYRNYLEGKSIESSNGGGKNIEWNSFYIEDIFDIESGVRLTNADKVDGMTPFIGATDSNNGITSFVGNNNSSLDRNLLGVNYNGSVVENFYHPYKAIFSDDVKRLHVKGIEGNKYVYLFLKAAILKQKSKYQYGYKFSGERMNRQKITLPATYDGIPDFEYMEKYMRNKESKLLLQYTQMRLAQY